LTYWAFHFHNFNVIFFRIFVSLLNFCFMICFLYCIQLFEFFFFNVFRYSFVFALISLIILIIILKILCLLSLVFVTMELLSFGGVKLAYSYFLCFHIGICASKANIGWKFYSPVICQLK
jgi:hypothetical protein